MLVIAGPANLPFYCGRAAVDPRPSSGSAPLRRAARSLSAPEHGDEPGGTAVRGEVEAQTGCAAVATAECSRGRRANARGDPQRDEVVRAVKGDRSKWIEADCRFLRQARVPRQPLDTAHLSCRD